MKFGELKSKIEVYLSEAYKRGKLKDNLFIFEQLVLKNKNVSKIFFLYDELSQKKNLNDSLANEFINESIVAYENIINKIRPHELKELNMWVGHIRPTNKYKEIDNLFSTNVLSLESKIKSKKLIIENLKKPKESIKEVINVPLKSMVNVANKTIKNFILSLNESERSEVETLLSVSKDVLIENYNKEKKSIIEKLSKKKKEEKDFDTLETIDVVLNKLKTESFSELNYYKLRSLNEGL